MSRRHAGDCGANNPRLGGESEFDGGLLGGNKQRRRAVVDARCIPRRDGSIWTDDRFELRQFFKGGGSRVFVAPDNDRTPFRLWHGDFYDFLGQTAVGLRCGGLCLTPEGEGVLVAATDAEFLNKVLGCFRHRLRSVKLAHAVVDEAPAHRGVENLRPARIGLTGLGHDQWSARHALDAAGQDQIGFARRDGACGAGDGLHARAAQTIDRAARNSRGKTGEQQRDARRCDYLHRPDSRSRESHRPTRPNRPRGCVP